MAGHFASRAARAQKLISQGDSTAFGSPAPLRQIFRFRFSEKYVSLSVSRSTKRGVSADRHERWGGMRWTFWRVDDEARRGGWQKRVVPIPRCRNQVCRAGDVGPSGLMRRDRQATVAKKPGRRGEHAISRKPLRRECRHVRRTCVDLRACFFPFARKAAGAFRHPVLPAPSFQEGLAIQQKPGRVRAARSRSAAFSCLTFSRRTAGANHLGSAPRLDCAMPVRPPTFLRRSCACR